MIISTETLAGGAATPAAKRSLAINQMEPLCAAYDCECVELDIRIAQLEADLEVVKQKHLPGLKKQAAALAAREAELYNAVENAPDMFERPKTLVIAGTKIGFSNSIGSVVVDDEAQTVKLVEKHFGDRFDELVKTERTPRKDALRTLAEKDLAKLGCRIEGCGPVVIVKRVSGDVEKLINKLIEKLVGAMVKEEAK
jgi:hypothetical protein